MTCIHSFLTTGPSVLPTDERIHTQHEDSRCATLDPAPVSHAPAYAAEAGDVDDLLVPAKQDAHGGAGGLSRGAGPGADLAEPGGLRGEVARGAGGGGASAGAGVPVAGRGAPGHALVPGRRVRRGTCVKALRATG